MVTRSSKKKAEKTPPLESVVVDDRSTTTEGSKAKKRPGLPVHLAKQLLTDVEKQPGGIKYFSEESEHRLSALLDARLDVDDGALYGRRGDPIRRQITKYVTRWKSLTELKYLALLNQYQVPSAATRKINPDIDDNDDGTEEASAPSRAPIKKKAPHTPAPKARKKGVPSDINLRNSIVSPLASPAPAPARTSIMSVSLGGTTSRRGATAERERAARGQEHAKKMRTWSCLFACSAS